jgi:hypothetical protein
VCNFTIVIFTHFSLNANPSLPALETNFSPYMQAFLPFLYPALKAHEDTQLCTVAVGIIGDISRALGDQSAQYANPFMTVLLENLQSEVLNRNVKISILSCFGDIALAIGPSFEPYLDTTMSVLRQAGAVQPNPVSPPCFICPGKRWLTDPVNSSTLTSWITSVNCVKVSSRRTLVSSLDSKTPIKVKVIRPSYPITYADKNFVRSTHTSW